MAETTTTRFDLERVRDLSGRGAHVWYRRVLLTLMLAFVVAALLGAFGQISHSNTASGPAGTITVHAPHTVRGGLLFPARVTIRAAQKLVSPQIVLGGGWAKGMQLNTIEPSPASETTRPSSTGSTDDLAFTYPTLQAGDSLTLYLQVQVDPTTIGHQDTSVSVEAANARPIRLPASLTVLP
ncbi:MAG: hypothetical protein AAGC46_04110 [Solirubrobacteraceae bacterium]|nr:hypothetical protein [Patulibacter sp.]